ncbi:Phosphatidyl-N-methylethanolamine N-methyltransferase [Friedmanniomyces endolithicus]|nr:Phosphatidyl-N-methylethanolamine N-methyltransferase [Friedmanniomyces endolithicus]
MANLIDFTQPSLYLSAATILFNPLYWNLAARNEYHHRTLTTLFNHNALHANYALALSIFLLGLARDAVYESALRAQPTHPFLLSPISQALAVALVGSGTVLVLSSMYALGITGTYLGDYFGILMDEMVTGFPFNVTGSPMYWGSTMSFVGTALWFGKPAGLVLAGLVWGCYRVALGFEDPFTREIYARRERERGKKAS